MDDTKENDIVADSNWRSFSGFSHAKSSRAGFGPIAIDSAVVGEKGGVGSGPLPINTIC